MKSKDAEKILLNIIETYHEMYDTDEGTIPGNGDISYEAITALETIMLNSKLLQHYITTELDGIKRRVPYYENQYRNTTESDFYHKSSLNTIHKLNAKRECLETVRRILEGV